MADIHWRLYYGDGSVFDDSCGRPEDAPAFDVQVIRQSPVSYSRKEVVFGEWYYWDGNEWRASDIFGVIDLLLHRKPVMALCQGRWMAKKTEWNEILEKARNDGYFSG